MATVCTIASTPSNAPRSVSGRRTSARRTSMPAPPPVWEGHDEDRENDQPVVRGDRMHVIGLAERGRVRIANAPREAGAGDCVVLAVDHITDPADRLAERDPDHRDVEHEPEGQPKAPRHYVAGDARSDRRAGRSDAAVPERHELERPPRVDVPVVGYVSDPRRDEAADDDGDRERVDPVILHEVAGAAERDEASDDHPHQREDRVPRDARRTEVEVWVEREVDQAAIGVGFVTRARVRRRASTVMAAANTSTAMV